MRKFKLVFAVAVAVAASVATGHASAAALRYGVADDWPKYHPCGDAWWQAAQGIGYTDLRITEQWNGSDTIDAGLKTAVDCAALTNMRLTVAIYPAGPSLIGSSDAAQSAFAAFVALVGTAAGPTVTNFIVGNEPNVNRFWQPQFVNGHDAAGADYEHTLAKSYDALKAVRPDARVWGPAISSRGNDNANAASNPSHSPVWFIKAMGDAYRASGRTQPILDVFDMHPYPPTQDTDPFSKPFQWPQAGAANLDRVKQALWDAFHGTGQPVPTEQPGGNITQGAGNARFTQAQALPISFDEVGEQTVVTGHDAAYVDQPDGISPISEELQAAHHVELMEIAACDPDVESLLFFPLIDESDVHNGFQSGNLFADLQPKQSYAAVKAKIASAQGACQGGVPGVPQSWVHADSVLGAQAFFGGGTSTTAPNRGQSQKSWAFNATATEDAAYTATLARVAGPGGGSQVAVDSATGLVKAYRKPAIRFKAATYPAGWYQFTLTLSAAVNSGRTATFTSNPFKIGNPPGGSQSAGVQHKPKSKLQPRKTKHH